MELLLKYIRLFPLKLLLVVTVISLLLGQFHPFSTFPMYSSFPDEADLYYLCDAKGDPLPSVKTLGLFGPEIKQRIEHQAQAWGEDWTKDETLEKASQMVLDHLAEEQQARLEDQGIKALRIRRVSLSRSAQGLQKNGREVAAWP